MMTQVQRNVAKTVGLSETFRRYGAVGMLRLIRDVLVSKLVLPQARIVRYPFYLRGKRHMRVGKGFTAGVGLRLDAFPSDERVCLTIGERVEVNDYVHIGAVESVTIGNDVLIASKVFISDHNHGTYSGQGAHSDPSVPPAERPLAAAPVVIEDRVWLGEFVCVLPGVKIGAGSVIGAHSVVSRDIPANCIAVGSPARVVKQYCPISRRWVPARKLGDGA